MHAVTNSFIEKSLPVIFLFLNDDYRNAGVTILKAECGSSEVAESYPSAFSFDFSLKIYSSTAVMKLPLPNLLTCILTGQLYRE